MASAARYSAEGVPFIRNPHKLQAGRLTPRQAQIVTLFVGGMSYAQIATELGLSVQTINPTLRAAAKRMGIPRQYSRSALRARAIETGNLSFDHVETDLI